MPVRHDADAVTAGTSNPRHGWISGSVQVDHVGWSGHVPLIRRNDGMRANRIR